MTAHIFVEAASNLLNLKLRGFLALIGISIGSAAVTAMLHVGHSARSETIRQFESLGIDVVNITPGANGQDLAKIPFDLAQSLSSQNIGIEWAIPIIATGATLRAGRKRVPTTLVAAPDGLYNLGKVKLAEGRPTSDLDGFSPFAVIGANIAKELGRSENRPIRIGDQVTLDERVMTIVGILANADPNLVMRLDFNNAIIVPFLVARRIVRPLEITNIAARLSPGSDDARTAENIANYFQRRMHGGIVQVETARLMIASFDGQLRVYSLLLLAIGSVSLVVGGVGIMNVMLMSILERRQEIGLRLAVGARQRDIRTMFLGESLLLSTIGSTAGTALGTVAGWAYAGTANWRFEASPAALPLGVGMALFVAIFFGSYPAIRAARLDPIAALRAE